jgi:dephospho-CoA kinase
VTNATTRSGYFPTSPLAKGTVPAVLIVGLTGGIGSGKSTVAGLLAERGAVVIDADRIARRVVEPGGPAYQPMIDRFGRAIVTEDGTLDRPAIAARVFNDPEALKDLNAITHPAIREAMGREVMEHARGDRVIVLDVPLLEETTSRSWGLAGVIVVDVPEEIAVERLVNQRGLGEQDARARINSQMSRQERQRLADVVIDNSRDRGHLEAEVERAWQWIETRK